MFSKHNKAFLLGIVLFGLVEIGWFLAFLVAPIDRIQGQVYRIIYLHVPSAITAFFTSFVLLYYSVKSLAVKNKLSLANGKATAEVGIMFTILTLITGSIWGRPTWGVYWTWDARLTTTLILALMYAGYLLLYTSFNPGVERNRACSVLGILIAACVPIVYKSVTWWRTLHQPPSLLRPGGESTMSSEIKYILIYCIVSMILFAFWLIKTRSDNIELGDAVEQEMTRLSR